MLNLILGEKMNSIKLFCGFVVLAIATSFPLLSHATTLGLEKGSPSLSSGAALIDYLEFGTDGDLSVFGVLVEEASEVPPSGVAEIGFGVGFLRDSPIGNATGGFDIFDDEGLFLGGDLIAIGFQENTLELQFSNLVGAGSKFFDLSVLMVLEFADSLGSNPLTSLVDGEAYLATISLFNVRNASAIPTPGTLSLAILALFGLSWLQKKRAERN